MALFSLALAFVLFNGGNTLKNATSTDDLLAVVGLTKAEGASIRHVHPRSADSSAKADLDESDLIPQQIAPTPYAVGDTISLLGGVFVLISIFLVRPPSAHAAA